MSSGYLNQEQRNAELQKPRLVVRIIEARGLKSADFNGYSDPYCEVRIKDQVVHHKTKVCKKTLNPFWNEEFILNPADLERDILLVKIYDWDANTSDDLLGEMEYPVHLFVNKAPVEEWKQVMDKKGPGRFVTGTGELKMMVTLYNSNQPLFFPGQQAQGVPYVVVYPGVPQIPAQVYPLQVYPQGYQPVAYVQPVPYQGGYPVPQQQFQQQQPQHSPPQQPVPNPPTQSNPNPPTNPPTETKPEPPKK